jgi:hypothetical protein
MDAAPADSTAIAQGILPHALASDLAAGGRAA